MARRPDDDPRVTDLRRYRKKREEEQRRRAAPRQERLLGRRPRAGLILALVVLVLAVLMALSLAG